MLIAAVFTAAKQTTRIPTRPSIHMTYLILHPPPPIIPPPPAQEIFPDRFLPVINISPPPVPGNGVGMAKTQQGTMSMLITVGYHLNIWSQKKGPKTGRSGQPSAHVCPWEGGVGRGG